MQTRCWSSLFFFSCVGDLLTVRFDLTIAPFDSLAQLGPAGEIFEVKSDIIRLSKMIQVAGIELEKVHRRHRTDDGHLVHDLTSCVLKTVLVYSSFQ